MAVEIKHPSKNHLVERLKDDDFKSKVIKRASRLLNPLANHPFLRTMQADFKGNGNTPIRIYPDADVFSTESAMAILQRAKDAEKKKEGTVRKIAEKAADKGIVLLSELLDQHGVTRKLEQMDPFKGYTVGTNLIDAARKYPEVKEALSVIKLVTEHMGGNDPNNPLTPEKKLQLFTATVGFSQVLIIDKLDLEDNPRAKNQMRDKIIVYSLRNLESTGQGNIAKYIIAQKTAKRK